MMLPIPSKALLSGSLKTALPLLLAAALAAFGYRAGWQKRDAAARIEAAKVQQAHDHARLAAEQAYSAKLAEAAAEKQRWFDYAQAQSARLAATERSLEQKQHAIRQEIPHAIRKDDTNSGRYFGGLGADGLRLYRQAFGYSAD